MPVLGDPRSTIAYDSITVAATAVGLTQSNVRGTSARFRTEKVVITVETAQLRWRDDGTDPTASEGHLANVGTVLTLENRNRIDRFRAIRTGSTSATLRVNYMA